MSETYHHGNLRADLIEEGISSLCKDGIGSFSIRDLSRRLGVSHTAAYRHFPAKEDLLRAILVEVSRRFTQALVTAVPPDIGGREALMRLGVRYVRFFLEQPELLALFTMLPANDDFLKTLIADAKTADDVRVECSAHADCGKLDSMPESSGFGVFRKYALPMRETPLYAELSDREILLGFWSKVHGLASILVSQKDFIPADKMDETVEKIVRTAF